MLRYISKSFLFRSGEDFCYHMVSAAAEQFWWLCGRNIFTTICKFTNYAKYISPSNHHCRETWI